MAVLLIVAGIVWPALQGRYEEYRLKSDVEHVRAKLAGTRIRAIDSGLMYQFLYEPGGRNFVVVPYEGLESETDQTDSGSAGLYRYSGTLSENTMFQTPEDLVTTSEETPYVGVLSEDFLRGLPNEDELRSVAWSEPILFFPDGTSIFAAFDVRDTHRQMIMISVRELTGTVTVDSIRRESR